MHASGVAGDRTDEKARRAMVGGRKGAPRLTDQIIRELPVPERHARIVFDDKVTGFGVRITAKGHRSFLIAYRRKSDGRQRRYTFGSFGAWNTVQARELARRLKRDGGSDPQDRSMELEQYVMRKALDFLKGTSNNAGSTRDGN
jgi:hypothetical protein